VDFPEVFREIGASLENRPPKAEPPTMGLDEGCDSQPVRTATVPAAESAHSKNRHSVSAVAVAFSIWARTRLAIDGQWRRGRNIDCTVTAM
jgi:hypothetical protein